MKSFLRTALMLTLALLTTAPGFAYPQTTTYRTSHAKRNEAISGTLAVTGNTTVGGTLAVTGNTTITGTLSSTGGISSSSIATGAVKRKYLIAKPCPAGGAAASNTTVYFQNLGTGRAGTVTKITFFTHVDPVSGTNTIKVLKNGASGNTLLSTASVSLNGSTADTIQTTTLTSTAADLALAATDTLYCEYSAGTQGSAAKDVTVIVEFEPTDF